MDDPANATGNPETNGALTQAVELWRHALPRLVGPELYVLKTAVKHQVMLLAEQSNHCACMLCPTANLTCSGRDLGDWALCSEHLFQEGVLLALPVQTLLGRMAGHRL